MKPTLMHTVIMESNKGEEKRGRQSALSKEPLADRLSSPFKSCIPAIEKMEKAWKACTSRRDNLSGTYERMVGRIKRLKYSVKDVEAFSFALDGFQTERDFSKKAGLFLSALVNTSEDCSFVIHTAHLAKPIDFLGYRNAKNLVVVGRAGKELGRETKGGSIRVNGNVGDHVGFFMHGGSITLERKAGYSVGNGTEGGRITTDS